MVHDFIGIYQNRLRMEDKPVFSAAHDSFLETALHAVFFEVGDGLSFSVKALPSSRRGRPRPSFRRH